MKYSRNMGIMNSNDLEIIMNTKALVVGVGGLGGYIASSLIRMGVSNITIIDSDDFDESNLNRQIFSDTYTLNESKVYSAKNQLLKINPDAKINVIHSRFKLEMDLSFMSKIDIVFDAVDNIKSKLSIEKACSKYSITLIHGAIAGWYGQVGIVLPGSNVLSDIYGSKEKGIESTLMSPTFTPAIIANMMISEFVKYIIKKDCLIDQILYVDLLKHEYRIMFKK